MRKIQRTAQWWRLKAVEARVHADGMRNPDCREIMERIAEGYQQLADRMDHHDALLRLEGSRDTA